MRENREKWMELCEQAANEQDPQKLQALIVQICVLLEAKEHRLKGANPQPVLGQDRIISPAQEKAPDSVKP